MTSLFCLLNRPTPHHFWSLFGLSPPPPLRAYVLYGSALAHLAGEKFNHQKSWRWKRRAFLPLQWQKAKSQLAKANLSPLWPISILEWTFFKNSKIPRYRPIFGYNISGSIWWVWSLVWLSHNRGSKSKHKTTLCSYNIIALKPPP